jgi:hypothetical protein
MGQSYRDVLGWDDCAEAGALAATSIASGSLGKQLVQLRQWLYNRPTQATTRARVGYDQPIGHARLRGIQLHMSAADVLQRAGDALKHGVGNPAGYQCWYVQVGEQRVSPKWLVSQLAGLPISSFHSAEARRVLQRLGVEVLCE